MALIKIVLRQLRRLAAAEAGATAIEYALIASLLSIVIIGAVVAVNGSLTDLFDFIRGAIIPAIEGAS